MKNMSFKIVNFSALVLISALLHGCLSAEQLEQVKKETAAKQQARIAAIAARKKAIADEDRMITENMPICKSQAECKVKWEAAQLWIANNADYKLQTVSDVLLETFGPFQSEYVLAVKVTKEPIGKDEYLIKAEMSCGHDYDLSLCRVNPRKALMDFQKYVNTSFSKTE